MSFVPYSRQQIEPEDREAVLRALDSDFLTQGPEIAKFEEEFAAYHEVPHAVALSNATAGLHLGCLALGAGPGKLVWTSPNSFAASANCAIYCGADVDFVDIDAGSRNMSVAALAEKLETAERRQAPMPDIVIPVDFAGFACDLHEMRELADRYGFRILEDASHATGATYCGKRLGGQYSDAAVFSFHAVKIVTTGEGGMVTSADPEIAERVRMLRTHGITRDPALMAEPPEGAWYYEQQELGFNYRMTDIQAALGRSQLARIDRMASARTRLAERYMELLADLPLKLPRLLQDRASSWHLYVVELEDGARRSRAELFADLRAAEIGVNVHYIPIHLQPYYRARGFKPGDFPSAEDYYARALTLPLFPQMTDEQQDRVVAALRASLL